MPATTTERPMVDAVRDGDWLRCGSCGTRGPLGLVPAREGARYPCQSRSCGVWNRVPVPAVRE